MNADVVLRRYEVETDHGVIIIMGTDEQDARLMAEKAGYKTYSAKLIVTQPKEHIRDYINWCKEIGVEPC